MNTLLILRHAKSSWKHQELSDHDRPLNKRGERDAPRVGERLDREGLVPDLIVTSTARRASDTAALVAANCAFDGDITADGDLYHADPESTYATLRLLPDEAVRVLVVGHNPGFEDLLETLTGGWERFPTAALARVELDIDSWRDIKPNGTARLVSFWRPREEP